MNLKQMWARAVSAFIGDGSEFFFVETEDERVIHLRGEEILRRFSPEELIRVTNRRDTLWRFSNHLELEVGRYKYVFSRGLWMRHGPMYDGDFRFPEWLGFTPKDLGTYRPAPPRELLRAPMQWAIAVKAFAIFFGYHWAWTRGVERHLAEGNLGKIADQVRADWRVAPNGGFIPVVSYSSLLEGHWEGEGLLSPDWEREQTLFKASVDRDGANVHLDIAFTYVTYERYDDNWDFEDRLRVAEISIEYNAFRSRLKREVKIHSPGDVYGVSTGFLLFIFDQMAPASPILASLAEGLRLFHKGFEEPTVEQTEVKL